MLSAMTQRPLHVGLGIALTLLFIACDGEPIPPPSAIVAADYDFDAEDPGEVPIGWRVAGTGQGAATLAEWAVVETDVAASQPNVLALVDTRHDQPDLFNICWTSEVLFANGKLSVKVRAVSGKIDQGGGAIWRVQDPENYYVCRANPRENNLRLYKVVDGVRRQLASADVAIDAEVWHAIDVTHVGETITCTLNNFTTIEATDEAITTPGGIGVWTKADAITMFDDIRAAK
jgi:hypothetical protein